MEAQTDPITTDSMTITFQQLQILFSAQPLDKLKQDRVPSVIFSNTTNQCWCRGQVRDTYTDVTMHKVRTILCNTRFILRTQIRG